jgi:hypothetical protein
MSLADSHNPDGVVCREEDHGSVTAADEGTGLTRDETRADVPTLHKDAGEPVTNEDLSERRGSSRTTPATNTPSHQSGDRRSRVASVTETSDVPSSNVE